MILHHSFQQSNFSRCCDRSVLPRIPIFSSGGVGCNSEPCHPPEIAQQLPHLSNTIGRPICADNSRSLSASPGNADNQFANLNAKSSHPLGSPFHAFGLPRLLSDPTPSVQFFVNSARESSCSLVSTPDMSSPPGTGTSPGREDCCAVQDILSRNSAEGVGLITL